MGYKWSYFSLSAKPVWCLAWILPWKCNFILEQPPVSVFSLRRSNAIDPTQLGQPLEQHNSCSQAVGEVMMWWGPENFTKSHMEGERLSFPWDRNREEQLKWHWQEEQHSCSTRGTGDKSLFTCGDIGLGCKMHNPKFSILNHWQTPWKVWNTLRLQCGWDSPTPPQSWAVPPKPASVTAGIAGAPSGFALAETLDANTF